MTLNVSEEEIIQIVQSMKENKHSESYYLRTVDDLKWFDILKSEGFFSPEKVPLPEFRDGTVKYWWVPYWDALDYLKKVAKQSSTPENERYADELIQIVKGITKYHIEHNLKLDNLYVWEAFVEILSNLPSKKNYV